MPTRTFDTLGSRRIVLGMVHLDALPGTPYYEEGSYGAIREKAVSDARALEAGGADGCVIQNRGDRVFPLDRADPVVLAAMTDITRAVSEATGPAFQIGVQILRNDLQGALAVVRVAGGSFLRCGALVGATVTGSGIMEADPYETLVYRRRIGAGHVRLIAEIFSMHFDWLGGRAVEEVAGQAAFAGADAVALCDPDEAVAGAMVEQVKRAHPTLPVLLSGYTHHENVARLLKEADGAIVGSCLERGGRGGHVQEEAVRDYVTRVRAL